MAATDSANVANFVTNTDYLFDSSVEGRVKYTAYSDDDDERDEVISVTATIIDGDMSAEDGNDGSDDDDPDAEACPWSYLDLRRDFYAEGGVAAALSFHESHGDTTAAQAKAGRDSTGQFSQFCAFSWDRIS